MKKIFALLFLFTLSNSLFAFAADDSAPPLSKANIDPKGITISGVSSGAYMAVQMEVAFSKTISGSGSIAGGIYWCAKGDSERAQTLCMGQPGKIDSSEQIKEAQRLSANGEIDPIENLASHKIYIYASPTDSIINPVNSDKLQEFYLAFAQATQIQFEKSISSAHGFPTLNYGNICTAIGQPWLLKCNFDTAGNILHSMYGDLAAKGTAVPAHLRKFSQAEFGNAATPLYNEGWVYIPDDCAKGELCKLHVALHGCLMNPDFIQDQFATFAGYNDWAETNHIIVLYPQSAKLGTANPYACWDWFGFTGTNYVSQSGAQMKALKAMIDRVSGK